MLESSKTFINLKNIILIAQTKIFNRLLCLLSMNNKIVTNTFDTLVFVNADLFQGIGSGLA
jgi:hypothetical protein